ncbi:MAG: hypothetical protein ICCCNLDF_02501 [Planctomycetes bacterium]|nr:hypothetical protein [Planctomycetota bacterium]
MADDFETALKQAADNLAAADAHAAFQAIHHHLRAPCALDDADLARGLDLLARVAAAISGDRFAGLLSAVTDDMGDAQVLYNAAYEAIEEGLHGIAATLLERANAAFPNQPSILAELSSALEGEMLYERAAAHLQAADPAVFHDPVCAYLLAFNSLMSGRLQDAREAAARFEPAGDENLQFMKARLERAFARADAVAGAATLDNSDLRGWHFVLQGALLTHLSTAGYDDAMRGRYAWLQDSYVLCRQGLDHLKALLAAVDFGPRRVVALGDRGSSVLATAAAELLGVPLHDWTADTDGPELVVAYDLASAPPEQVQELAAVRPGRLLFAHACGWTEPLPFVADVTTLLHQMNRAPWDGGLRMGDQGVEQAPPDDAPVAELAARVLAATYVEDNGAPFSELLKLAGSAWPATAFAAGQERRERYFPGGPVKSNRFN